MPLRSVQAFDWSTRRYAPIIRERAAVLNQLRDPTPVKVERSEDGRLAPRPVAADEADLTLGALRLHALKQHYAASPTGPLDFVQDWGTLHEPRSGDVKLIPFVPFPRQVEFLAWLSECVREKQEGVVEKSREMGVTWLCVAFAIHSWLFKPGVKISFGSRKEVLIDKIGDPDSIFEKARIFINNLPIELRPADFDLGYMKLVNRDNGSVIAGEAGPEIGRGGRSTMYFVDEAAYLEEPDRVEAALASNTDVRIDVSTANGMGNPFYRKVHNRSYRKFRFHWRQDPRKTEAWYAEMKRKKEPHVVAQEIDIDYAASVERLVIPRKWVDAAIEINRLVAWPVYKAGVGGLDVGGGGQGRSVFIARFGPLVDAPTSWSDGDTTRTAVRALEAARIAGVASLNFDMLGVGEGVMSTLLRLTAWEETEEISPDHPIDATAPARSVAKKIRAEPINTGVPATDTIWPDDKRATEKFANLRAELWWTLRDRLRKTYEMVRHLKGEPDGVAHPIEELLALPADDTLAEQLCVLTWDATASGKVLIESKKDLARRGIKSPDFADALVLTFVPSILLGTFSESDIAGI